MAEPKLTPWFPVRTKPVYPGVYETRLPGVTRDGYSFWTGKHWSNQYNTVDEANRRGAFLGVQNKPWRGLAENPIMPKVRLYAAAQRLHDANPTWSRAYCLSKAKTQLKAKARLA